MPPDSGLQPYTGAWDNDQVVHLLRRTMFGAKKSDVDFFKTLTLPQAVETLLLSPATLPQPPINDYNDATGTDPVVPFGSSWVNAPYNLDFETKRIISFKCWWLDNMVGQTRSIQEKMVVFWHNHLATRGSETFYGRLCYTHNQMLRRNALGNFKTMTKELTLDPLMLKFLNGNVNVKGAPDENYGREIQELFVIGKGPDSGYTEADVKAAAKVLTGWHTDLSTGTTFFSAIEHDTTAKQFSSFYNNTVIAGNVSGEVELDAMLNMMFATQEAAKFVCRKIYRFFVYHTIDATVETNIITPLATIFRNASYEIIPVMRALLNSQHFYDVANKASVIKSPTDFIVGMMREFSINLPPISALSDRLKMKSLFFYTMADLGEDLGDPPNVAGWKAWYQTPQYDKDWITTVTAPKRGKFTDIMLYYAYPAGNYLARIDVVAYTQSLSFASNPNTFIAEVIGLHYRIAVGANVRAQLKAILLSGQTTDSYWTDAWALYISDPTNATNKAIVETRLKAFYHYLLVLEEYQLH
jgi:uncharacterized protein (DUF1800 family)